MNNPFLFLYIYSTTVIEVLNIFYLSDIATYCKTCYMCGMVYRYQEFEDGLHNFDDSTILGLHLCLFLRAQLQVFIFFIFCCIDLYL